MLSAMFAAATACGPAEQLDEEGFDFGDLATIASATWAATAAWTSREPLPAIPGHARDLGRRDGGL
ncbi:hypothetical protein BE20_15515 [Sorangium cellulosum]|nr:hypothetical protein BE20_15515 [Sorangium cellulosum]